MAVRESALQRVQRTCQEAVEAAAAASDVVLDEGAIAAAAATLPPPAEVAAACQYMRLPIRFDSMQAEVNAMALFHLMDFGSGFDSLLLAKIGKDARETVQFGLLGMLMHGAPLESRQWMAAFGPEQVFQFFNIDATVEAPVPGLPGVTMSRQGPLGEFTGKLRQVVSETGEALEDSGIASLGAFILSNLDRQMARGGPPSAAALVEALVEELPVFDDKGLYRSKQVYFYRRAQLLVAQLHLRFRGADPRFRFADMDQLSMDSGNVLPAVLRRMGVLRLSEGLAEAVDAGKDLQGDERERALRAATVAAGAAICHAAAAAAAASGPAGAAAAGTTAAGNTVGAGASRGAGGDGSSDTSGGASGGGDSGSTAVQPWQLSMYLLYREEQAQRAKRDKGGSQAGEPAGQGGEGAAAADAAAASKRHVARGTLAY